MTSRLQGPGRPPEDEEARSAVVNLRAMAEEIDTWRTLADAAGVSLSEWLRALANTAAEERAATVRLGPEPSAVATEHRVGPGRPPVAERTRTAVVRVRATPSEVHGWKRAAARAHPGARGMSRWLRALANAVVLEPIDDED